VAQTAEPQAILVAPTEAAIFLVLVVDGGGGGGGGEDQVRELLGDVGGLIRSVAFRVPDGGLSCVVGIGSALWDRLAGGPRPGGLHPFAEIAGTRHTAVSTAGDLLLHIRARRLDLCFELAQRLVDRLRAVAEVVDEVHGFKSFDERDLLGFVDGTENPVGASAPAAALIGDEDPRFAGGSYVLVQRYVHNLASWDALAVAEQERVVGRTKLNDIELADDVKPANSHVALTTIIDEDGGQRQILRYNMPFGRVGAGEFGTYFIGYARSPDVLEQMLTNMFVGRPAGNYDRILDFSTATTGTLFFAPSVELLEALAPPAAASATDGAPPAEDGVVDAQGSLGIGGLR
jgi:putative iron-dependent peroxidase